jgi:hypothetical protein
MAEFNISSVKTTDPGDIYGILCVGVNNSGTLLDPIAFITSFTETDPVFTASPAAGVTSQKITNWDAAFGWGNHASAGYQSALGFTPLNRAGDSISATNGSGFIGYPSQSGTPSTPSSGFRFYANASHALSWVGQNGFTRTFDGTANTANRAYTLPNASGTIALEGTLTSLANPTIQNGFYQFTQNTKPTQRAAGVPLVAGDRWYNTSNRTEWFWNGTYWLSLTEFLLSIPAIVGQTTNQVLQGSSAATTGSIFVDRLVHQTAVLNSTNTATNYWTLAVQVSGVSTTTISTQNAINYPHQQVSLGLVIPALAAIPAGGSVVFSPLGQTARNWIGMTVLGIDIYASVFGGDIYKQTNATGNFLPLGQTSRQWRGMTVLGTDIYACVFGGDIYKQTNATGNFLPLGQTSRQWIGMVTLGTDIYASVYGGDIYKQTNGGDFLPLGQTSRLWYGMTVLGNDVYACVQNGDIYKQTNATGNFLPLGQTSRNWNGMTVLGNDVYACVQNGDIYKQTNATDNFLPLGQTSRQWIGMITLGTDIYACVYGGDIYQMALGDTVGHSVRVTTARVGTETTSLYSAMSLTYREVL